MRLEDIVATDFEEHDGRLNAEFSPADSSQRRACGFAGSRVIVNGQVVIGGQKAWPSL